jgi:hypothetical protein
VAFTQNPVFISCVAEADLSAYQYHFVKLDSSSDSDITIISASTDQMLGVLYNDPDADGEAALVAVGGVVKIAASATSAITPGTGLSIELADTAKAGKAYPVTEGSTRSFGIALESLSSGSGIITMLIRHNDPS